MPPQYQSDGATLTPLEIPLARPTVRGMLNPEAYSPSWLIATGQDRYLRWLMLSTLGGVGLTALRWVGGAPLLSFPPALLSVLGVLGVALICGGLLLMLIQVRCQSCQSRVALYFIRTSKFSRWLHDLQAAKRCPKCGHHPSSPA